MFGAVAKADQRITCILQPETLLQGSEMYPVLGYLVESICLSCIFLCDVYFEPEHELFSQFVFNSAEQAATGEPVYPQGGQLVPGGVDVHPQGGQHVPGVVDASSRVLPNPGNSPLL